MMNVLEVKNFYQECTDNDIELWIDGGWAVDALVGKQSREHEDLDIVLEGKYIPSLRKMLIEDGYKNTPRADTCNWNFVLGNDQNRLIDIHAIRFDHQGNGLYGPLEKGMIYPSESLTGIGKIGNLPVHCISVDWLIKFHCGYPIKEKDVHDVLLLCTTFHLPIPVEYKSSQL